MIGRAAFFLSFGRCGISILRYNTARMSREEPTIEAEVVEIDGVAVEPRQAKSAGPDPARWKDWGRWQGRVKTLNPRWWPLWLLLGFILLVLVVAIGLCVAVLSATYWIMKSIIMGIVSLIVPSSELQRR